MVDSHVINLFSKVHSFRDKAGENVLVITFSNNSFYFNFFKQKDLNNSICRWLIMLLGQSSTYFNEFQFDVYTIFLFIYKTDKQVSTFFNLKLI